MSFEWEEADAQPHEDTLMLRRAYKHPQYLDPNRLPAMAEERIQVEVQRGLQEIEGVLMRESHPFW